LWLLHQNVTGNKPGEKATHRENNVLLFCFHGVRTMTANDPSSATAELSGWTIQRFSVNWQRPPPFAAAHG